MNAAAPKPAPTTDPLTVASFLETLLQPGKVFELRALNFTDDPEGRFASTLSGFFNAVDLATAELLKWSARGSAEAWYVTLNPLKDDLLALANNRLKPRAKVTAADTDVLRRTRLLIDVDPVRKSGISSTAAELALAETTVCAIRDFLAGMGFPEPIRTMSGNGAGLIYAIDLPTDDGGLVARVLKSLAARFDTADVKVDVSVHNPARITKLIGTVAAKGENMPDRPHRMSRFVSGPETLEIVPEALLVSLAGEVAATDTGIPLSVSKRAPRGNGPRRFAQFASTTAGVASYLREHGADVRDVQGNKIILGRCPIVRDCESANGSDIAVLVEPSGKISYKNLHNRGEGKTWADVREALEPGYKAWVAESRNGKGVTTGNTPPADDAGVDTADAPGEDAPSDDDADLVRLGERDPKTGRVVLSAKRTLPTAQAFIRDRYSHSRRRTLHSYADAFFTWQGNSYRESETGHLRNQFQSYLHKALRYVVNPKSGEAKLRDFESNPTTVKAALDSLRDYTHVPATRPVPYWIGDDHPDVDPADLLAFPSGLLHLPTRRVLEPTSALFNINAIDFDYDPNAPAPTRWLEFLGQIWGDDVDSINALQEWFGYAVTSDTSLQKMLALVGPKRSGKGTIGRVLRRLVGIPNVAGPTTGSLAGLFGLQPLIGKSLAIVSDARFSGDGIATVIERLLCISGEDALTIDRKFLGSVTMKLLARFVFLTNEIPRLTDASGALAGRFVLLRLSQSFYGREDTTLSNRLMTELPGILLWALEGRQRLIDRGHFVLPESSRDAMDEMEELASPISAFARDWCKLDPALSVPTEDLYEAWVLWSKEQGTTRPTDKHVFGRDLRAAIPSIALSQPRSEGIRHRAYKGINLTLSARETLTIARANRKAEEERRAGRHP